MIGKIICDLAPSKQNNRNSEGAFIKLKNGELLYAYTRYRGEGHGDSCKADLYGIISNDNGESFGKEFLLLSCDEVTADNVMSVSLMRMKNGDLGLFYLKKQNEIHSCVPYLALSSDEGRTWSRHIRCIEEDAYYVLNNDRVIRLNSGRLLMPVARHIFKHGELSPAVVLMYASDDDGLTWKKISDEIKAYWIDKNSKFCDDSRLKKASFMEPGVVQLANGNIWCFIRTVLGRQYEVFSEDNGETWSVPCPSEFTSAESPMSIKKLKDQKLIALWNPIPNYDGRGWRVEGVFTGKRTFRICNLR